MIPGEPELDSLADIFCIEHYSLTLTKIEKNIQTSLFSEVIEVIVSGKVLYSKISYDFIKA